MDNAVKTPSNAVESQREETRVKMLIDGKWREASEQHDIVDPYRGTKVGSSPESSLSDLDAALAAAFRAKTEVARMPAFERAALLRRLGKLVLERVEPISQIMMRETGKPIKDARMEVSRSEGVITLSAEEAVRIEGAQVPMDAAAMGAGKLAVMWRFPVGVVAGITPFNAPFNLAWHKIAPALAAGNSIVLKAPPQAAMVIYELSKILVDGGVPPGWVNILYGNTVGPALVKDPRVDFITFTGSSAVGTQIKASSGLRRVALELGGTGPTIIHHDANIGEAVPICSLNAMRLAGQSCLSVQNVYVHEKLYDDFTQRFVQQTKALKVGDPADPETDVGTLIDEAAAKRVEAWVNEAVAAGAKILTGGTRQRAQFQPTVITDATPSMRIVKEEIFGPVAVIHRYDDIEKIFERVNDTPFGLHCGVFTRDMQTAFKAIRSLRFGGVIVNGSTTWRTDQMPYGGVKNSGIGREGPRYAVREMTEERLVIFNI